MSALSISPSNHVIWLLGISVGLSSILAAETYQFNTRLREEWTTSKVAGSPDPSDPYVIENAFKNLRFTEPLSMCLVPGSNRFCVATRSGKLYTFEISPSVQPADWLIDMKRTVYEHRQVRYVRDYRASMRLLFSHPRTRLFWRCC